MPGHTVQKGFLIWFLVITSLALSNPETTYSADASIGSRAQTEKSDFDGAFAKLLKDWDQLQEAMRVLFRKEKARIDILAAIRSLDQAEINKAEKPFTYFEAWNNYVKAQENYLHEFGHYVERESATDQSVEAVISKDFENLLDVIRHSLRRTVPDLQSDKANLTSLILFIMLTYQDGRHVLLSVDPVVEARRLQLGLDLGVLFALVFGTSGKLQDLAPYLKESRTKQKLDEEINYIQQERGKVERLYLHNTDMQGRYAAFYSAIVYKEREKALEALRKEIVKLIK